jgi:hypothetical protein
MLNLSDLDRQFIGDRETTDVFIGENHLGGEIWFEVAQMQNPEHEKMQRKFSRALERSRRNPKKQREIQIEIVARSILVGWRGLVDDDGNTVKCSVSNRIEVLTKYREVLDRTLEAASDVTNFQDVDDEDPEEVKKDTEKNSEK